MVFAGMYISLISLKIDISRLEVSRFNFHNAYLYFILRDKFLITFKPDFFENAKRTMRLKKIRFFEKTENIKHISNQGMSKTPMHS